LNIKRFLTPKRQKIYLISLAHLIHDIYTSFLSPVLPILIENFSLSYTFASLLRMVMRIPSLLNPLIGHIADNSGLKYFVALAPAITAVAMSLIGNAPNYWSLLILLFIAGISSSFFHVPAPVILKKISDNRLGASMSCFQIGGELSRTIGPIIVLGAISLWGFSGIYRLIPFGVIISLILLVKLKNEKIPRKKTEKLSFRKSISETLKHEQILFIALTGLILMKSFTASVLAAFLPTYLKSMGYSLWMSGGALSILQAAAIIGVFLTGTISDRIGRKRLLILLGICSPLTMFIFLFFIKSLMIPTLILLGFLSFSSTPVILALIQESNFKYPSIANGMYMMISFIVGSLVVLLFGITADIVGLEKAFYISAACSLSGLPFVWLIPER